MSRKEIAMSTTNLILIILGTYFLLMVLLGVLALSVPNNRICPICHSKKKWNDLGWKRPCQNCKENGHA